MLLALVEALVQRRGGIRELLERGAAALECLCALGQTLDRIALRLSRGAVGAFTRRAPLGTQLGEIAQRAFQRRPVLFLFGGKLEAGMQRGDAGIAEGRDIFSRGTPALRAVEFGRTRLSVGKRCAGNRERARAGENGLPHGHLQWRYSMGRLEGRRPWLGKLKFGKRLRERKLDVPPFRMNGGTGSSRRLAQLSAATTGPRPISCARLCAERFCSSLRAAINGRAADASR